MDKDILSIEYFMVVEHLIYFKYRLSPALNVGLNNEHLTHSQKLSQLCGCPR